MRLETRFEFVDALIGVNSTIIGPAGAAHLQLILDTGATMTTLVPRVAEALGFTDEHILHRSVMRTAAAVEHGYVVEAQVEALGFTITNLQIVVAELGYDIDGLLGMDFLSELNLEIRPREQRIYTERLR